jgi:hypothetical protein
MEMESELPIPDENLLRVERQRQIEAEERS